MIKIALELSVQDNEEQMSALENERRNLQRLKSGQQQLLGQYIRSSYKSGRQEYFKFLLNQENPSLASRNLRYYSYFYEARSKKLRNIQIPWKHFRALRLRLMLPIQSFKIKKTGWKINPEI